MKQPWVSPSDAPTIEQSIHDYIVSIFRSERGRRLEIIPISPNAEASRGWDAAVIEAVPLFFQYKLPDFTSRPAQSQPKAAEIRKTYGFKDDNGLFHFSLRKKAAKEPRSQHDLMLSLESAGQKVYYVATDFIDQKRLRFGGDLHACGRPWIPRSHLFAADLLGIREYTSPWFDGLICIPPFARVSDPVENHKFLYNQNFEVSLHSEPAQALGIPLVQVIADQYALLGTDSSINENNVEKSIAAVLRSIAGGDNSEKTLSLVQDYYNSLYSGSRQYQHGIMGKLSVVVN
ncbi:hypothetical protein [Pseudomonas syringae group genomosp. 3]|nr:hypothetical protein [Pseudomonas syringae group genomosp. 3]